MKEGNWAYFLRAFKVASNAECYEEGLIFLSFPLFRVNFALVFQMVVWYGGKKTGFGDIGNCRSLVKKI